jgi:hypothetical protein
MMGLLLPSGKIRQTVAARPDLVRPMKVVIRETIESALILCEGNRRLAAKRLGLSYATVRNYVRKFKQE